MMDEEFNSENFLTFRDMMMAFGTESPRRCYDLLYRAIARNEHVKPYAAYDLRLFSRFDVTPSYSRRSCNSDGENSTPYRTENIRFQFEELCRQMAYGPEKEKAEKEMEKFLLDVYNDKDVTHDMLFLLKRADEETIKRFAKSRLYRKNAFRFTSVDIIVKRNHGEARITGNTGHYLIYTCKGEHGQEKLLKFTNQASAVYYLMFLIHRCQEGHLLPCLELRLNEETFTELYRQVYDIDCRSVSQRFHDLIQRIDKYGNYRAGRLHEVIYDIRKRLEERFEEYDESFMPYAMTARQPLTVPAERIRFEGEAQQLLCLEFM